MMRKRLRALSAEKLRLMQSARAERAALAASFASVDRLDTVISRLTRGLAWIARHPLVLGALAAGLVALRPRPLLSWALHGLSAWQAFQEVRRRFGARPGVPGVPR
jgi:hypothetical protein